MKKQEAFTLVELLVVISIIALLHAVLFPVLVKARGFARGAACYGKLRRWGQISFAFAQDHEGKLPIGYKAGGEVEFPIFINDSTGNKTNGEYDDDVSGEWEKYGATWDTLTKYGMTERLAICPRQKWLKEWTVMFTLEDKTEHHLLHFLPKGYWSGNWRRYVSQSYMFLAGMKGTNDNYNYNSTRFTTGNRMLPYTWDNKNPSTALLVADTVMYVPEEFSAWEKHVEMEFFINHPRKKDGQIASQNILFADGHVVKKDKTYYNGSLADDNTRSPRGCWSYRAGSQGPSWYWEGGFEPKDQVP